jgi:hypothetical protein
MALTSNFKADGNAASHIGLRLLRGVRPTSFRFKVKASRRAIACSVISMRSRLANDCRLVHQAVGPQFTHRPYKTARHIRRIFDVSFTLPVQIKDCVLVPRGSLLLIFFLSNHVLTGETAGAIKRSLVRSFLPQARF